jgi:ferredoxin--NADP+ reductase
MSAAEKHSIPLVDVSINVVTPKAPVTARVVATRLATASRKAAGFVRHVEFDVSGTALAGKATAGQSFGIIPPGHDTNGKPHKVRLYSLASPTRGEDGAGNVVSTTVKRLIDEHSDNHHLYLGVCSNYVCNLNVGDEVLMTGPSGKRFVLPKDAGAYNYIFISTGTGIAPFRGLTLDLIAQGLKSTVALLSGSPYASDLLYDDLFTKLAGEHTSLRYLTAISRERQSDGNGKLYVDARLETNKDELLPMLQADNTLIYLCALAGMEEGVYTRLVNLLGPTHLEKYLKLTSEQTEMIKAGNKEPLKRVERSERVMVEVY